MGVARKASGGRRWANWSSARTRAANTPGVPVPGTGVRHRHKRPSGSNKSGALAKLNNEWSASGRKQEDEQRGINNRARRQNIEEQLAGLESSEIEWAEAADAANCWDDADDLWLIP